MRSKVSRIMIVILTIGIMLLLVGFIFDKDSIYREIFTTIPTIIIPTSIVGLLYQYEIRNTFLIELKDSMNIVIDEKFEPISNLNKLGITDCYMNLSSENLKILLQQCENKIRICKSIFPSINVIDKELAIAIKKGVKVEICLTHPDSSFAKYRNEVLQRDPNYLSDRIRTSYNDLIDFKKRHKFDDTQIILRQHSEFLPVSYHQFDDKILIGLLLYGGTLGNNNPIIKVERNSSPMVKNLIAHYDYIWDKLM